MRQKFLYHGSTTPNIRELKPRKRYVPEVFLSKKSKECIPPAIYASDDPAYAACFSFLWASTEGFDLSYEKGVVVFTVPKKFKDRLKQKSYLYKVPKENFELLENVEPRGRNFWCLKNVKTQRVVTFEDAETAIKHFGGKVVYKD